MICEREVNKLTNLQQWVSVLKHVPKPVGTNVATIVGK